MIKIRKKGLKNSVIVGILLLFFVIVAVNVNAVGISGGNLDAFIEFEPELEKEFTYGVIVTNPDINEYETFVVDELAKYVKVEPRYVRTEGEIPFFRAVLKLPYDENELGPGKHCGGVGVVELIGQTKGQFISRTSAKARICVRVLYEGKKIEAKLHFPDGVTDSVVKPRVEVSGGGKEKINSLYADIVVFDAGGGVVDTIRTIEASLEPKKEVFLEGVFDTSSIGAEEYSAKAVIYYDEEHIETKKVSFRINEEHVKIIDYTKKIVSEKINDFDIKIKNMWDKEIKEVYGRVVVDNKDFKTASLPVEPWQEKTLKAYIDAGEVEIGNIPAKIIVYYNGKKSVVDFDLKIISEGNIVLTWFRDINRLMILLVLLVIIVEVIWIIEKKRSHKKK